MSNNWEKINVLLITNKNILFDNKYKVDYDFHSEMADFVIIQDDINKYRIIHDRFHLNRKNDKWYTRSEINFYILKHINLSLHLVEDVTIKVRYNIKTQKDITSKHYYDIFVVEDNFGENLNYSFKSEDYSFNDFINKLSNVRLCEILRLPNNLNPKLRISFISKNDYVLRRYNYHAMCMSDLVFIFTPNYEFKIIKNRFNVPTHCWFSLKNVNHYIASISNSDTELICLTDNMNILFDSDKKGYHEKEINHGTYGELSKIKEELEELEDACEQNNKILILNELSDMIGAIEGYVEANFEGFNLKSLIDMSNLTKRAFKNGSRK